jgi:hypothetical protein
MSSGAEQTEARGHVTDAHDEVVYVIRKPEDRFARVV